MLNKFILHGRLVRNPELKKSKNDKPFCEFTIVSNFDKKNDKVLFQDCVAFDKIADTLCKYFVKGQEIMVCGPIYTNQWTDRHGNKRQKNKLEVYEIHFCGTKNQPDTIDLDDYEVEEITDEQIENLPW